ncbi:hypothetical protein WR25_08582 [Diploscapter pachys]|uniref:ABC-2 type transporter domain-containing protein n=1 Tax=Diploscapter pachys TaxID=2018661 RepID=A0A2A2JL33_9BILA|nr:hypothetical protein WR25_08582 [Diploscapter pachys]
MLLLDDPIRDLEPLASFQLMTCLFEYAKRYDRIIVVSMRAPRSDINQLLTKMTMLFYGEVAYSGSTKSLPSYFNDIGFPCPINENPVVYYLSLLTVDRESGERFQESQEQADKLVEKFKDHSSNGLVDHSSRLPSSRSCLNSVALCSFHSAEVSFKIKTLLERTIYLLPSQLLQIFLRIFALPFATMCLAIFCPNFVTGSWTAPHSSSGILRLFLLMLPIVQSLITFVQYSPTVSMMYIECGNHLYNPLIPFGTYSSTFIIFDLLSVVLSAALLYWTASLSYISIYLKMCFVFVSVALIAQFVSMTISIFIRRNFNRFVVFSSLQMFFIVQGSGMLRPLMTLAPKVSYLFSYANPYRYAYYLLIFDISGRLPIKDCRRDEKADSGEKPLVEFCRWTDSLSFRRELFGTDTEPLDYATNATFLCLILFMIIISSMLLHYVKKPKFIIDKFRFRKSQV